MRFLFVVAAACSSTSPAPHAVAPMSAVQNVAPTAGPPLDAQVAVPAKVAGCPLRWGELDAPARIRLHASKAADDENCPGGAPLQLFAPDACTPGGPMPGSQAELTCEVASMRGRTDAAVQTLGPEGSGRFWSVEIMLDTPSHPYACLDASTVGYRQLYSVGEMLAPLPWLADLDGNGESELILWRRLPWADSEVTTVLYPVVYVLDGEELVRRDDVAAPIRMRVANAYREVVKRDPKNDYATCLTAIAQTLEAN